MLAALAERFPANVAVGAALQELELERAVDLAPLVGETPAEAAERLRAVYRERAEAAPTPTALVLAARLEPDQPAAELLLARAARLDPACAAAHYGLAHVLTRGGDHAAAREALDRALAADPAHLPAVRLHAWLLLAGGRREQAVPVLEAWLEAAAGDPTLAPERRAEAQLDLALALLAGDRSDAAADVLEAIDLARVSPARWYAARAVLESLLGRNDAALAAARAAQAADPRATLPAVQEALLLELWLGRPDAARDAWQGVLERSAAEEELGGLVQRLRAEVHLQRLDAAAAGEAR